MEASGQGPWGQRPPAKKERARGTLHCSLSSSCSRGARTRGCGSGKQAVGKQHHSPHQQEQREQSAWHSLQLGRPSQSHPTCHLTPHRVGFCCPDLQLWGSTLAARIEPTGPAVQTSNPGLCSQKALLILQLHMCAHTHTPDTYKPQLPAWPRVAEPYPDDVCPQPSSDLFPPGQGCSVPPLSPLCCASLSTETLSDDQRTE